MEIQVRLFASLRKYTNENSKLELEEGARVGDFLERIGIPPSDVAIILVNGRHATEDRPLQDGETVSLFPAIAGG
jgi:molybdopterin converting factor small subunit